MKNKLSRPISAAAAAALIMLSGCTSASAPEPAEFDPDSSDIKMTLRELYDGNTDEAMLRDHENFYVTVNLLGDKFTEYGYFRNKDLFFYEYLKPEKREHNADLFYSGGRWYMDYSDTGSPDLEYRWYAMSDDEMRSMIFPTDIMSFLDPDITDKERIFDITEGKSGMAYMFTTESRDAVSGVLEKYGLSGDKFNGARFDHKYTFEKETGDLLLRSDYLTLTSGDKSRCFDIEIQYDTNEPDFLKMVTALTDHVMNDESAKKITLTAVYDDGQTFTMQYNGNYKVSLVPKTGYKAYTDAQKSAVFDGYFAYSDTTVYLFKE